MKSLLIKLYNLQKKLISEDQRKKFFKNKKSSVHSSFKLGINNYIDISENAEITIEEGVTITQHLTQANITNITKIETHQTPADHVHLYFCLLFYIF